MCPPPTAPRAPGSQSLGQSRHTAHPQLTVRLTPHTSPQRPRARSTFHHWPGCPRPVLGSGLELQRPAWAAGGCLSRGQRVLNGEQTARLRCRPPWEPAGSQELGVGGLREAHSPAPARERGTEGPPLGPPSAQSRALPTPRNRTCAPDPERPRAQVGGFHRSLGVGGLSSLKVNRGTNEKIDGFDYRKLNLLYAKKITELTSRREKERKEAVGGRGRERQGEGGEGWNRQLQLPRPRAQRAPWGGAPSGSQGPGAHCQEEAETDLETSPRAQVPSAGKPPSITCCPVQTQVTGAQVS